MALARNAEEILKGISSEARRDRACELVNQFQRADQVRASEILAYADAMKGTKFRTAHAQLKKLVGILPISRDFTELYISLGKDATMGKQRNT